jgi:WD40 repeat protein
MKIFKVLTIIFCIFFIVVDDTHRALQIQQPNLKLVGHTDVVSFAQWLSSGDQIITASWDRTSNIFDAASGKIIKTLTGYLLVYRFLMNPKLFRP